MAYKIESSLWSGVFAVPNQVADAHLKMCGSVSLKVLLLVLRHGGALDLEQMAQILGQPTCEIQDALNYWIHLGVIAAPDGESAPAPAAAAVSYREEPRPKAALQKPREKKEPAPERPGQSRRRLTTAEINEMAAADNNIAGLLQETQGVLGKPLTPVTTEMVMGLYSYYGMSPDLILMLVQYCVSAGKDSARYIEKVAAGWLEKGIDTHEKAEAEILRATQQQDWENQVKRAMGIYDRSLVTSEKNYIAAWAEQSLDLEVIRLAYERTVELKGKVSFPYINGILSNWSQKGVRTVAEAAKEIGQGQRLRRENGPRPATSYDLDELEQMIVSGDSMK